MHAKSQEGTIVAEVSRLQRAIVHEHTISACVGSAAAAHSEELSIFARRIVEAWPYLALLIDRHRDIVAASTDGAAWGRPGDNLLHRLVQERATYLGWDTILPAVAMRLRRDLIDHPDDPRYRELAGELGEISKDFQTAWRDQPSADFAEVGRTTHTYDGRRPLVSYYLPVDPSRDIRAVLSVPAPGSSCHN